MSIKLPEPLSFPIYKLPASLPSKASSEARKISLKLQQVSATGHSQMPATILRPAILKPYPAAMRFDIDSRKVIKPPATQGLPLLAEQFHRLDHQQLPHAQDHALIARREEDAMLFIHEMKAEAEATRRGMSLHKTHYDFAPNEQGWKDTFRVNSTNPEADTDNINRRDLHFGRAIYRSLVAVYVSLPSSGT